MLTEDYCSYEVAKLLDKKGFREYCEAIYFILENGDYRWSKIDIPIRDCSICKPAAILCPTHQMAMKWLREVHKLHIEISVDINDKHFFYASIYYNGEECWEEKEYYPDGVATYEEAVEAALKHCLTNLI